ncbi:MAG: hypothetical protein ACI841_000846 [Planctomycetota bacterium]|jgi:hypothetical protein
MRLQAGWTSKRPSSDLLGAQQSLRGYFFASGAVWVVFSASPQDDLERPVGLLVSPTNSLQL